MDENTENPGMDLPPYTCDPSDQVVNGGVAFFDQNGNLLNSIEATACTAEWFIEYYLQYDMYPGTTSMTWRPLLEWLAENPPPLEPPDLSNVEVDDGK